MFREKINKSAHSTSFIAQLIVGAIVFAELFFVEFCKKHFREISHRFRFIHFREKVCEIQRKFSHFFTKVFVRWKP